MAAPCPAARPPGRARTAVRVRPSAWPRAARTPPRPCRREPAPGPRTAPALWPPPHRVPAPPPPDATPADPGHGRDRLLRPAPGVPPAAAAPPPPSTPPTAPADRGTAPA